MDQSVGVRALQQNAAAVVSRAAGGEVVEITDRGRPVARVVPLATSALSALITAGQARPATRRVADLPAPISAPARQALGEILAEARAAER